MLKQGYVIVLASMLFFVLALVFYPKYPDGYWIAASLFVIFGSEFVFGYLKNHPIAANRIQGVFAQRALSLAVCTSIVCVTWVVLTRL
ncbi:hypothetical protein R50072_15450 [Simiduia litorea]